jgi:hypothetical protein
MHYDGPVLLQQNRHHEAYAKYGVRIPSEILLGAMPFEYYVAP